MPKTNSLPDESELTAKDEIMAATGRAIGRHGLADLTTQKIANEWGKSQSLLHYYFETKAELLVSFVESMRAESQRAYEEHAEEPPLERIRWLLNRHLNPETDANHRERGVGLFELHAQAGQKAAYRDELNRHEDDAREFVETAIRDGIEEGTFRAVDSEAVSLLLLSIHDGVTLRARALRRDDDVPTARQGIEKYVLSELLVDDATPDEELDATSDEELDTNGAERK